MRNLNYIICEIFVFAMLYLALLFFISLRVGQIQYRIDNAG